MRDYHYLIPQQQQGLEKDMEHSILCETTEDAEDCFVDAKERLLDVNNWSKYSGIDAIEFRLNDSKGKDVIRHARKGDHITIDMPGQGSGRGFDWVAIEAIEYDDYPDLSMESFAMRLHPSSDPAHKQPGDTAYSLTDDATSTFVIVRIGKRLSATYHGRNEPGTDGDAWLGLSEEQWAGLISGIVETGIVRR